MKDEITIPSSILTDESLSASEKLIAIYCFGADDVILPQDIIDMLDISAKTVYSSLITLAERGIIARRTKRGFYRLAVREEK